MTLSATKKNANTSKPRVLARIDDSENPVVTLLNEAMQRVPGRQLTEVAEQIDYRYVHLWQVYRSQRKLPIAPLLRLCQLLGLEESYACAVYAGYTGKGKSKNVLRQSLSATDSLPC